MLPTATAFVADDQATARNEFAAPFNFNQIKIKFAFSCNDQKIGRH